jgi:hypothetical protein
VSTPRGFAHGCGRTVRRATVALTSALLILGFTPAPAAPQRPAGGGSAIVENRDVIANPTATVSGVTPTPESTATAIPVDTSTPEPGATPTPAGRDDYLTPGYGSAAEQSTKDKRREHAAACKTAGRPPTSPMLGVPGVVAGDPGGSWVPLVVAVAVGAALFAVVTYTLRRRAGETPPPGPLEGIATLVAICGGLAGLAAQFVPSASVKERPSREVAMVVRDVKPSITRREYLTKMKLPRRELSREDLDEIGNVVWLEITLKGFKQRPLSLEYGLYDLNAREALLPGTSKPFQLREAKHDVQTSFVPVWVGYPKSTRFKAEFRLIDPEGVQQLTATGAMHGSPFRYACERRS